MKYEKFSNPILIVIVIIFIFFTYFPHQTKSTEVGVRIIKWSPFVKKGVVEKVYAPGATYFFPPIINDWYTFDAKLQNMEMTASTSGARHGKDDLIFKTIDGNDIALDVIIAYRIIPEKAANILQNVGKNNKELEEKLVRPLTRNITRELFGELKTEDFYVANKRTEKAEAAKEILNKLLEPYGVIIESVLPKDYRFMAAYQRAIEDKKVADQMVERFKSEVKAVVEEYNQRVQQAQGEVNQMIAGVDGEFMQEKISADAYYQQQEKIAKAIEVEGIAEAKGIAKMVQALNSSGGETLVKIRLAEALQGKKIYLLPFADSGNIDLKTTDINDLLRTYGVKQFQKQ